MSEDLQNAAKIRKKLNYLLNLISVFSLIKREAILNVWFDFSLFHSATMVQHRDGFCGCQTVELWILEKVELPEQKKNHK